jgi:PAS domain S-box-containing protein/putative nucleotidyltransferase with HDIG domain
MSQVEENNKKHSKKTWNSPELPTVLVAEDDEGLNRLIQTALKREGFKSEGFFTGADAVRKVNSGGDILLLIDFLLPDMTAVDVIRKLRAMDLNPPFIVVTGQGDEKIAVEMMKLGARDYVVKNTGLTDLVPHILQKTINVINKEKDLERAENALKESENRYRGLVETSEDLIWQCDKEGKFTYLNKAWEKTHGYSIQEMVGRPFTDLEKPDVATNDMREFQSILKGKQVSGYETVHISRSGKEIYLVFNAVPLYDSDNKIIGVQGTAFDITKRVLADRKVINSKDAFFNMLEDVNEAFKELEGLFTGLVRTMVNALDAKSPWTKGHSERVAMVAQEIAKKMGFDEEELKNLWLAGILHDIGKIGTYDYLLDKPGKLTKEEFEIVKKHPAQGAKILGEIKQLEKIIPFIRHHHERLDGRGYPDGLKGDDIPLYARIMHVADSYDSMTSDRPYMPAPPREYAVSEFIKYKGTQFDPQVVEAFLGILDYIKDKNPPTH